MAVKFLDAQGNVTTDLSKAVTRQLRNPGLSIDTNLPGEGELFFVGGSNDPNPSLAVRQGASFTNLGAAAGAGQANVQGLLDALGLRREDIGRFSTDITGAPGSGLGLERAGETSDFEFFRGFAPTQVKAGLTRTEDPAAIAASLDPSSQQNVQARAGAAQRFGEAGQTATQAATAQGVQISNEADLQAKREELTAAGVDPADFSKFISSPDAQGRLFFQQPATLTSPSGEKRVVATGSQEASQLLSSGFTLGDQVGGGTIDTNLLNQEEPINIDVGDTPIDNTADLVNAGAAKYTEQQRKIAAEIEKNKRPEDEQDLQFQQLLKEQMDLLEGAKSFETIKAEEKAKADITAQQQVLSQKMDEIDILLAKSLALDNSYQAANAQEDLRVQTLSRAQGAKAANYRNYIAQHNLIASDTALLVAEGKALEGKLSDATQSANDAINLRYQAQQDAINNKINMLNLLIPQINKKDKEYANAVKAIQERELAIITEKKSQLQNAVDAGIYDRNILNQIEKAEPNEAIKLIAENMPAPVFAGGGGRGVGVAPVPQVTVPTFEEFIIQKENQLRQNLTVAGEEEFRDEYNQLVAQAQATPVVDAEIQSLVTLVNRGTLTANQAFDEVPRGKESLLSAALAATPAVDVADTLQDVIAREKSQQAIDLKTHKGLNTAVGPTETARGKLFGKVPFSIDRLTGQVQSFIGGVQKLVSGLSLEALIEAKSRGATFGALSDTEMLILSSAATQIGTWVIKDEGGNVLGYNIDETSFKKELDSISKTLLRGLDPNRKTMFDGTVWEQQSDGTFKLIE